MQLLHALFARDADGAGEAAAADEAADDEFCYEPISAPKKDR